MKRGVLFDLGGTLFSYGNMAAAWSDWLEALHNCIVSHGLTESIEALAARCDGFHGKPEPLKADGLSVFERRIRAVLEDLEPEISDDEIREIASNVLAAWWRHVSLDVDAPQVLRILRPGFSLGLVSNFDHPSHIHEVLDQHGLTQFFDSVVISGEVGVKKPDPRILELALDALDLEPESCIYVGDTEDDERCALAAGMKSITIDRRRIGEESPYLDFRAGNTLVNDQPDPWRPIQRIRALGELIALLNDLEEVR